MSSEVSSTKSGSIFENEWVKLFLISFAVLFFEVLLIRWIAAEMRIFGYFKNLILIAAIVGMGIGCALGGKGDGKALKTADIIFPVLITILCTVIAFSGELKLTDMSFLITLDVFVWDQFVPSVGSFGYNVSAIILIFMLIVVIFDLLGQKLGANLAGKDSLKAYAINLLGSLSGVLAYTLLCYLQTSPWIWLSLGFLALAPFYKKPQYLIMFVVSIALAFYATGDSRWSPYYRIDLKPFMFKAPDGREVQAGQHLDVNHDYHQTTMNFGAEFLKKNADLLETKKYKNYLDTYNLPYVVAPSLDKVLVLGAGSGNDVAAALRNGAKSVDAVEIDPTILSLGREIHPELPYSDKRVEAHNNDARAFLSNTDEKFDVIVFGHVDSLTTFSTLSSVRLDNFLYTKESIESATRHLSDKGIGALSFAAGPAWLRARLFQVVEQAAGSTPVVLKTQFINPGAIVIFWGPGLEEARKKLPPDKEIIPLNELNIEIEMPTDNWPFLYQEKRNIPPVYLVMLSVVFIISSFIVFVRMRLTLKSLVKYSQFFFLGAGFLLLETRGMLAVSVLFGSTWLVNSIVIATVLLMALAANSLVMKVSAIKQWHGYLVLFAALALMYFVPLSQFAGSDTLTKLLVSVFIIGLPFACSGIVFSRSLADVKAVEKALGINILGALLGGCLEYTSTIVGTNGLTVISMVVYLVSLLVALAFAGSIKSEKTA